MNAAATTPIAATRKKLSSGTKRGLWIGLAVLLVAFLVFGTKVVPNDSPLLEGGAQKFDPAVFGAENFPQVQEAVVDRAVPADELAAAIAADPEAAAAEFGVKSSGGTVYSTVVTGVVGEGNSGIYELQVEGVPADLLVRVQTGPAVNGTDLRDATGDIEFGQFTNQIDYQNAASALNEMLKTEILADIDTAALTGKTVTVTGAFTLVNPAAWLLTPVELEVR